jgi:hypothetical protein
MGRWKLAEKGLDEGAVYGRTTMRCVAGQNAPTGNVAQIFEASARVMQRLADQNGELRRVGEKGDDSDLDPTSR